MVLLYVCCSQGLDGRGLPSAFLFATVFASAVVTISPGLAVPEASTISLVLPEDGGLKGAGPDEDPDRSQGFGGALVPRTKNNNIMCIR